MSAVAGGAKTGVNVLQCCSLGGGDLQHCLMLRDKSPAAAAVTRPGPRHAAHHPTITADTSHCTVGKTAGLVVHRLKLQPATTPSAGGGMGDVMMLVQCAALQHCRHRQTAGQGRLLQVSP